MKSYTKASLWITGITIVLALLIYSGGLFRGLEQFFEDRFFSQKPIDTRIVILSIDNESLQKIGQWPWPRKMFADALTDLGKAHPAAVGVDVVFSEPSRYGTADDATLSTALTSANYPIIFPVEGSPIVTNQTGSFETPNLIKPLAQFSVGRVDFGHVNLLLDADGIARMVPVSVHSPENIVYQALAYQTVLKSGFKLQPRASLEKERIVYAAGPGSVRRISFARLSDPAVQKDLEGKIVFIGVTASDLHDSQLIPLSQGIQMPGVEIQAQVANMLLKNYTLVPLGALQTVLWIAISALLVLFFFLLFKGATKPLIGGLIVGVINLIVTATLFEKGTVAHVVSLQAAWLLPTVMLFVYRYFSIEKEKREMRHAFSKYVSEDVLHDLLADPSKIRLGGEERNATVFFSDVRGFTTLSEKMTPTQLTHFLNKYLTVMTNIILEKRGVVDKYIGDAIMAFWGAPLQNKHHALHAIQTSLLMVNALEAFNKQSIEDGDPVIDIGIGLNSGKVTAGNMGSERRFDYTVMGDTVNLASRLESLTKNYGVHILISEFTYRELSPDDWKTNGVMTREVDRVKVKGKKLPVALHEVVDPSKQTAITTIKTQFETARDEYYKGNWSEAAALFAPILETIPNDGPTKTLHERCVYFTKYPPESWDGSYEMKTK